MTTNTKPLKPCPFCGDTPMVKYGKIYLTETFQLICPTCKVRTRRVYFNCKYLYYHERRNVFVTEVEAKELLINLWNTRSEKC